MCEGIDGNSARLAHKGGHHEPAAWGLSADRTRPHAFAPERQCRQRNHVPEVQRGKHRQSQAHKGTKQYTPPAVTKNIPHGLPNSSDIHNGGQQGIFVAESLVFVVVIVIVVVVANAVTSILVVIAIIVIVVAAAVTSTTATKRCVLVSRVTIQRTGPVKLQRKAGSKRSVSINSSLRFRARGEPCGAPHAQPQAHTVGSNKVEEGGDLGWWHGVAAAAASTTGTTQPCVAHAPYRHRHRHPWRRQGAEGPGA
jgi:hypothetical protein